MSARGLAGIEVELTAHDGIEWERNLQGLVAFLEWNPVPARARPDRLSALGLAVDLDR
jgi:hypothetical protein